MNLERRNAREIALQLLFQSEFAPQISLSTFLNSFNPHFTQETISYAEQVTKGVREHLNSIDNLISSVSRNWKVDRMAFVDRNILRVAVYELKLSEEKLSGKIVINEALEIAKKYGSSDSAGFINGLLDQINREEWPS